MPEIQFKGDFHHIEISPDSQLDIGQDVIFQSFTSLNVASGAQLKLGTRVFFNDHCTVRCQHSIEIGKDTILVKQNEHGFLGFCERCADYRLSTRILTTTLRILASPAVMPGRWISPG